MGRGSEWEWQKGETGSSGEPGDQEERDVGRQKRVIESLGVKQNAAAGEGEGVGREGGEGGGGERNQDKDQEEKEEEEEEEEEEKNLTDEDFDK